MAANYAQFQNSVFMSKTERYVSPSAALTAT